MNETLYASEVTQPQSKKTHRRQKSTSERLKDKQKQLDKATEQAALLQKKIKGLEADIKDLETKRQQEILEEYDMSLSDLEAFLKANKTKIGDDHNVSGD